jgi:hypothetical protein
MYGLVAVNVTSSCEIDYGHWHHCSYVCYIICFVIVHILKAVLPEPRTVARGSAVG